jgi:ATP-binding cassette subfamily B protein
MRLRQRLADSLSAKADAAPLVSAAPGVSVRQIFRRFWPDARPYRFWLLLSLPFIVAVPAIATVEIWFFKLLVDEVLVPRDLDPLLWLAAGYVGLTLVGGLVSFVDEYLAAWIGERFLLGLRSRLYRHLLTLTDGPERRRL